MKVVYKQFVVHPDVATIPALAVCAAQKQHKFEPMEKMIWEKGWRDTGGFPRPDNLSRETMEGFAKELKLDVPKFKADLEGESCKQQLESNKGLMQRLGVRGTPGFFVNGRYIAGAQAIDRFKVLIDEEIKKADDAVKNGAKLQDYYATIVASGKKSI